MKKVVLALAVVFSVAMVSCGNKEAKVADSDTAVVETVEATEVATDSDTAVVVEAAAEEAPAEAAK